MKKTLSKSNKQLIIFSFLITLIIAGSVALIYSNMPPASERILKKALKVNSKIGTYSADFWTDLGLRDRLTDQPMGYKEKAVINADFRNHMSKVQRTRYSADAPDIQAQPGHAVAHLCHKPACLDVTRCFGAG